MYEIRVNLFLKTYFYPAKLIILPNKYEVCKKFQAQIMPKSNI